MSIIRNMAKRVKARILFETGELRVLHFVSGRIRLQVRSMVGQPEKMDHIVQQLKQIPELTEVTVNPATGSILLQYVPEAVAKNPLLKELESLAASRYRGNR